MEKEREGTEYASGILDPDFGQRIAAMVQAEVARSLEGLDIAAEVAKGLEDLDVEAMVHVEIEKAMSKIEHKVARAREKAHKAAEKMARHQAKMLHPERSTLGGQSCCERSWFAMAMVTSRS